MRRILLLLPFVAGNLLADVTPYSVATLVQTKDESVVADQVTEAFRSPDALVRATAARVIAVRGLTQSLPLLRETVLSEADATAAREEIRALVLLGSEDDIVTASKAASRWPAGMDNALAVAAARRGGFDAVQIYVSTLRKTRMNNASEFFRIALWGHANAIALAGSRLLAEGDEVGWRGILGALEESGVTMSGGVMASSLGSRSEDIRAASAWYLVRGNATNPSSMDDAVKNRLAEHDSELSSDRVDFGVELLRRMLGGERKDDPRWLKFLESSEADGLLRGETLALQYLTDAEYLVRYNRCEVQSRDCAIPAKRSRSTIPSQPVARHAFTLPEVLPAGLTGAVMDGARCRDAWLGVANASVDPAGRIRALDLAGITTSGSCKQAIDTLLRLSLATNTSLRSEFSGPVLLVHAAREPLCLDEDLPESLATSPLRMGGDIDAPKVIRRVEPRFPEGARKRMGRGRNVNITLEAVITKDGCLRSLRVLSQSPYPELNGAALMAVSQWKFTSGHLNGKPVDVIFNLTINFKMN